MCRRVKKKWSEYCMLTSKIHKEIVVYCYCWPLCHDDYVACCCSFFFNSQTFCSLSFSLYLWLIYVPGASVLVTVRSKLLSVCAFFCIFSGFAVFLHFSFIQAAPSFPYGCGETVHYRQHTTAPPFVRVVCVIMWFSLTRMQL